MNAEGPVPLLIVIKFNFINHEVFTTHATTMLPGQFSNKVVTNHGDRTMAAMNMYACVGIQSAVSCKNVLQNTYVPEQLFEPQYISSPNSNIQLMGHGKVSQVLLLTDKD